MKKVRPLKMRALDLATMYERMADAGKITRARVRCERCEAEQEVDAAKALRDGWPLCHGYTMTLLKPTRSVPKPAR